MYWLPLRGFGRQWDKGSTKVMMEIKGDDVFLKLGDSSMSVHCPVILHTWHIFYKYSFVIYWILNISNSLKKYIMTSFIIAWTQSIPSSLVWGSVPASWSTSSNVPCSLYGLSLWSGNRNSRMKPKCKESQKWTIATIRKI